MPENRPRRPLADGLSRACFDGDLASVQQYLAEGADLLAPRPARGPAKQCMDSTDSVFLAIHDCSLFARADCLRALVATGNLAQLDHTPPRSCCDWATRSGPVRWCLFGRTTFCRFSSRGRAGRYIRGASSVTLASWGRRVIISSNEHTTYKYCY